MGRAAQPGHGVGEVQIHAEPVRADAAALVADVLRLPGGDVPRHQVAEGGVDPLQVVVALLFGNLVRPARIAGLEWNPHAAVVAQRLAHQR